MDELSRELQSLIQEACCSPGKSQRLKAMNKLLRLLLQPGVLQRTYHGIYAEHYGEALSKTVDKLSRTLCDQYDLNRKSPLPWIKKCYRNQLIDEIRAANRRRKKLCLMDIEKHPEQDHGRLDSAMKDENWELLRQWIVVDPDGILSNCCIRDNPKVNCQLLANLHIIQEREWRDIAEEIGISSNTLRSHWSRKCKILIQDWFKENTDLLGED